MAQFNKDILVMSIPNRAVKLKCIDNSTTAGVVEMLLQKMISFEQFENSIIVNDINASTIGIILKEDTNFDVKMLIT